MRPQYTHLPEYSLYASSNGPVAGPFVIPPYPTSATISLRCTANTLSDSTPNVKAVTARVSHLVCMCHVHDHTCHYLVRVHINYAYLHNPPRIGCHPMFVRNAARKFLITWRIRYLAIKKPPGNNFTAALACPRISAIMWLACKPFIRIAQSSAPLAATSSQVSLEPINSILRTVFACPFNGLVVPNPKVHRSQQRNPMPQRHNENKHTAQRYVA